MASPTDTTHEQLRLATRIARLYHERGKSQPSIASLLGITQTRVSRMLKFAEANGIVRTTVHAPAGIFADLEDDLAHKYDGVEFVVIDAGEPTDESVISALGSGAAAFFETAIPAAEIVGISSWSETLLSAVDTMRPLNKGNTTHIVQMFGGVGRANSTIFATRMTERLAELASARAVFLLAPGVVSSPDVLETFMRDPSCRDVFSYYSHLSMLLAGIGSLTPSRLLRDSGNVLNIQDLEELRDRGAVGDVCLRFFDRNGELVSSSFNDRVLGITANQIRLTPKRVAVAGGARKLDAIRAALRGRWVTTLITDLDTAQALVAD